MDGAVEGLQVSEWEAKFMDFINNEGELRDTLNADAFVSLVGSAEEEGQRLISQVLSSSRSMPVLRVLRAGVLDHIKRWMEAAAELPAKKPWVLELLKLTQDLPVDVAAMKKAGIGILIGKLAKRTDEIGALAQTVMKKIKASLSVATISSGGDKDDAKKTKTAVEGTSAGTKRARPEAESKGEVLEVPESLSGTKRKEPPASAIPQPEESRDSKRSRKEDDNGNLPLPDSISTPLPSLSDVASDAGSSFADLASLSSLGSLASLGSLGSLGTASEPSGNETDYFPSTEPFGGYFVNGSADGADSFDGDDQIIWCEPPEFRIDNEVVTGISDEDISEQTKVVHGIGIPEKYGNVPGGILKNKVKGIAGGAPLGSKFADALSPAESPKRGLVWLDTVAPDTAKAAHQKVAVTAPDAFQKSYLVAVKIFRKHAEPARVSGNMPTTPTPERSARVEVKPEIAPGAAPTEDDEEDSDEEKEHTAAPAGGAEEDKHKKFANAQLRERAGEHDSVRSLLVKASAKPNSAKVPMKLGITSSFPMQVNPLCARFAPWSLPRGVNLNISLGPSVRPRPSGNEIMSDERITQDRMLAVTMPARYPSKADIPSMPMISPTAYLTFGTTAPAVLQPVATPAAEFMQPRLPPRPPTPGVPANTGPRPMGARPPAPQLAVAIKPAPPPVSLLAQLAGRPVPPPRPTQGIALAPVASSLAAFASGASAPPPKPVATAVTPQLPPPAPITTTGAPAPAQALQSAPQPPAPAPVVPYAPPQTAVRGWGAAAVQPMPQSMPPAPRYETPRYEQVRHGLDDNDPRVRLKGTKPCVYYNTPAGCRFGDQCSFRHDDKYVPTAEEIARVAQHAQVGAGAPSTGYGHPRPTATPAAAITPGWPSVSNPPPRAPAGWGAPRPASAPPGPPRPPPRTMLGKFV